MLNLKLYQAQIDQVKATLPIGPDGEVYTTSVTNDQKGTIAGRVCINTPGLSAMLIVQGTHRLSTPDEIRTWLDEQARRKHETETAAAKKESKFTIDMSQFLRELQVQTGAFSPSSSHAEPTPAPASSAPVIPTPPKNGGSRQPQSASAQ